MLRRKNKDLVDAIRKARATALGSEAERERYRVANTALIDKFDALYEAVSVLATEVSNDTRDGRVAREKARKLLEGNDIKPPSTLGSSRNRRVVKKKRP